MSYYYPTPYPEGRSASRWQTASQEASRPIPPKSSIPEWRANAQNLTLRGQSLAPDNFSHSRLYPRLEARILQVGNPDYSIWQPALPETTSDSITDRPASIQELADRIKVDWDAGADFKHYLRIAERYRREGKECAARGDLESAFVQLGQAATLVLEKLPGHRDYDAVLNAYQRQNLALNGQDILDHLSELKPRLVDRYDKWVQHRPDYANLGRSPNVEIAPTAIASSNPEGHNAPRTDLIDTTRTPTLTARANAIDGRRWGSLVDSYNDGKIITSPMVESPNHSSIAEHVDRGPGFMTSSFSTMLSSIKTEDLTGSVRRESEYPAHGGGYADVYTGSLTRKGRTMKVAIKVIRSHTYTASNQWKIDKRLRREILLWSCLRHPNVVPLLGTTMGFGAYPAMVCPWMKDGNLSHYLNNKRHELTLRKRLQILADVIEGLAYLHIQPVIHGDLTTGNVLMDEGKAHLSDFGLSNVMIEVRNNSFMSSTVSGAPRWTAPELLHVGTGVPDVTKHCDIYSFGSIVLQTITGRIPYENIALDVQVLMEVMRGGTPARPSEPLLSDELWDLIASCWSRDPSVRPEIGQVRERLHVLRYSFSEEELIANIVDSEKSPEQDEGEHSGPWAQ